MAAMAELIGPVTIVTGDDKGSGKTTLVGLALAHARASGPVALATIGVDGAAKARPDGRTAELRLAEGDLAVTTEAFARASAARFEILDVLPGRTALGRLLLGRATRGGSVTLVGPEHLSTLAEVIATVRAEGWARHVLIDGAFSRLTQTDALGEAAVVHTARVTPATLPRTARRLRALEALADLAVDPAPGAQVVRVEGPLTPTVLESLGPQPPALSLADASKCFLDPDGLLRLLARVPVTLRRAFELRGIVVALRDVTRDAFAAALGAAPGPRYWFDPCAVRP